MVIPTSLSLSLSPLSPLLLLLRQLTEFLIRNTGFHRQREGEREMDFSTGSTGLVNNLVRLATTVYYDYILMEIDNHDLAKPCIT